MDIIQNILENATEYGVLLIPLIIGFVEMLKRVIIPEEHRDKFVPLIAVALGIGGIFVVHFGGIYAQMAITGLIVGLASCGLWTGGKAVIKKAASTTIVNNSGRARPRAIALLLIAVILLVSLVGCATLPKPQSPAQALLYVEASYISSVKTATNLINDRVIDADDAKKIQRAAHDADRYLDEAWEACGVVRPEGGEARLEKANALVVCSDQATAADRMKLAESVLATISAELAEHEGGPQ